MWLQRAREAGFETVEVLSRQPMGEDRLPLYPIHREGGLDALFALVAPDDRWHLVQSATIRAIKPWDAGKRPASWPLPGAVCRL